MPKISVIIPCYNGEKYLKEAIDSIINQTVKPFEIIYIDDCSTDNSFHIAFSHEGQHVLENGIRCFKNEKNEGIGFARKRGTDVADGDFIYFLSADDVLMPNAIEAMLSYAEQYPDSILYSDFSIIDESGNKTGESRSPEFNDYDQFTQAVIQSAKQDKMFTCWNVFSPIEIQKKVGYDENLRFGEDLDFLLRSILIHKIKYVHIPFHLFSYRIHREMMTTLKWNEIHANNLKTFEKINSLLGKKIL